MGRGRGRANIRYNYHSPLQNIPPVTTDLEFVLAVSVGLQNVGDALRRLDRHGALLNDDLVASGDLGDLAGHRLHVLEVGSAALVTPADQWSVVTGHRTEVKGHEPQDMGKS